MGHVFKSMRTKHTVDQKKMSAHIDRPSLIPNALVSLSNLAAFLPLSCPVVPFDLSTNFGVVYHSAAVLSMLMHMSETKHSLPGLPWFRKHSRLFLWLDRMAAHAAFAIVLYTVWKRSLYFNTNALKYIGIGLFGLILVGISESKLTHKRTWLFVVTHSMWHVLAFETMKGIYSVLHMSQ